MPTTDQLPDSSSESEPCCASAGPQCEINLFTHKFNNISVSCKNPKSAIPESWWEIVTNYKLQVLSLHWINCLLQSSLQFSSFQLLSRVQLFATPWIAACQASLSITNSQNSLRLMSIESVMPSSHLILCCPFSSCPQSLPASESFPMSQLFA